MRSLPLFVEMEVVAIARGEITLRNTGDFTILTRVYGQPSYRLIANDRWIQLPRDLAPGETATVEVPYRAGATLRLYHAIEGVPMLEPEAWHAATL